MPTTTLKGRYCTSICRVEAVCMLTRKKRHIHRKVRPQSTKSRVQPARGTQSGIFQASRDISTYSWNPNKRPSTTQPERKTTGRIKNGRAGSICRLVGSFGLIASLPLRSMRRSIHLLDGEILRVHFVGIDKQVAVWVTLPPYGRFLFKRSCIGQGRRHAAKAGTQVSLSRTAALQDRNAKPAIG